MKAAFWLIILASLGTLVFGVRHVLRKARERQRAEEARAAEFMAMAAAAKPLAPASPPPMPAAALPATDDVALQKLLFEAAHKAGEAGEAALAIQLYARLLARFPATAFAAQARDAVGEQKKRMSRAAAN